MYSCALALGCMCACACVHVPCVFSCSCAVYVCMCVLLLYLQDRFKIGRKYKYTVGRSVVALSTADNRAVHNVLLCFERGVSDSLSVTLDWRVHRSRLRWLFVFVVKPSVAVDALYIYTLEVWWFCCWRDGSNMPPPPVR